MIWLDLALGCLLAWGTIGGYQKGCRESVCSLGGLIGAVLASLPGITGLRLLWKRYWPVEEFVRTAVYTRLALPVSGGNSVTMPSCGWGLPGYLWSTFCEGSSYTAMAGGGGPTELLVQALGCTIAFMAGFSLWWGFFTLFGVALAGRRKGTLNRPSRWGGALVGLARQCCLAALLTGLAAPLAWLCGFPPHLLQLERTLLGRWAWQLFACLGIWH